MAFLSGKKVKKRGWRKNRLLETSVRRHERDFSFQREAAVSPSMERTPSRTRRNQILIGLTVVLLSTVGGLMIFHPAFGIQVVSVTGLQRTNYAEVQKTAELLMASPRWGFLPRRNYFLLNSSELSQVIKDRFLLEKVVIERIFPHALNITVTERKPFLVVAEKGQVSVVDQNGEIVEKIGRLPAVEMVNETLPLVLQSDLPSVRAIVGGSSADVRNLPILLFDSDLSVSTSTPSARADILSGVLAWNLFLRDQGLLVSGYSLRSAGSGEVVLEGKPKLLVNFIQERDKQFLGLTTFLKEKKSVLATSTVGYLDLRYPGKVFWK